MRRSAHESSLPDSACHHPGRTTAPRCYKRPSWRSERIVGDLDESRSRAHSSSVRTACHTRLPGIAPKIRRHDAHGSARRHLHARTMAPTTAPPSTPSHAKRCGSATSAPAPTGHAQTAKENASSAQCSAAGPTARLRQLPRAPTRAPRLARLQQSTTTTRLPRPPTTAPTVAGPHQEHRAWDLQLPSFMTGVSRNCGSTAGPIPTATRANLQAKRRALHTV